MEKSLQITIIVSIAIIIIAISALAITIPFKQTTEANYASPQKRKFWLFNSEIPKFNEIKMGMSHDVFSMSTITVNKGDNVTIHFFNTELPGGDSHSFTIEGKTYDVNIVLNPGENKTVSFDATTAGVFPYECTFHQPTMQGQLIVLASGQP